MADSTQEARARRTAARDERRSRVSKPFEELDEKAQDVVGRAGAKANGQLAGTAAKVVGTAAAAALLGALGGAAKAMLEHRDDDSSHDAEDEAREHDAPEIVQDGRGAATAEDEQEEQPEERDEPVQAEAVDEHADEGDGTDGTATDGISGDAAAEIAMQARRQLERLLGTEAERVSGLERRNGGWAVTLEVVEVARIPESTDVLATYELMLDDDRNLVSVNRGRRYRRSQIDEGS